MTAQNNTQLTQKYFDDQLIELIKLGRNDEALSIIAQEDDFGCKTDCEKSTLLHYAAKVENPVYVNAEGRFQSVLDSNKVSTIVKILIDAGATVIDYKLSRIKVSSILSNGNRELIRIVLPHLDLYFIEEFSERTPLDYLFNNHNLGVCEELYNVKFDVNKRCNRGRTPLHRAASALNTEAVKFLLKNGADVNAKDNRKRTPLFVAVDRLGIPNCDVPYDCIYTLLENGADPQIWTRDVYNHNQDFEISWRNVGCKDSYFLNTMNPVINYLALQEACGRAIDPFMLKAIENNTYYRKILDSSRQKIEEMKQIQIYKKMNLFGFLTGEKISTYVQNGELISSLTRIMKKNLFKGYYDHSLQQKFLKCTRLIAINDIFVQDYNISVIDIAEKIINYS